MKIKIATWNMAYWQHKRLHDEAWNCFLNETKADIFLFQEGKPNETIRDQKDYLIWNEIGRNRDWGSGIYSPKYRLFEENVETQFKGVFSIGNTYINNEKITLISLYGLMESGGPTNGYSITNLHRMLSDLTGLFNGHIKGKRKIILGGDLNASKQFDEIQKNNSHKIFFDRIEDFGLNDVYKLSGNKSFVQTLRHVKSKIPWQNDYFFISNSLVKKFTEYEIIDNEEIKKFSDHNILVIQMEL